MHRAGWPDCRPADNDHAVRGPRRPGQIVADDLRRRIDDGEWQSGEALPTVASLAAHYGVGRATVSRALAVLEREGLIVIVASWGSFRV